MDDYSYEITAEENNKSKLTVTLPNGGNVEYLKDNENCLLYKAGNISQACEKIENLIASEELQQKLYLNGLKTAKERAWENVTDEILEMYGAN